MALLAGAVGSFFLFAFLGLLALPVTAFLDKKIGKEKALLLWAVVILALVVMNAPAAPSPKGIDAKRLADLPKSAPTIEATPFAHPGIDLVQARNIFQKHSDTRDLPPIVLQTPPWVPLDFPLPPTSPGPAPGHQQSLQGAPLRAMPGDGATIPEIPVHEFGAYDIKPEDVYDWVVGSDNRRLYAVFLAIQDENGRWHEEGRDGDARFHELKRRLNDPEVNRTLRVRWAAVGFQNVASKRLSPADIANARNSAVTESDATEGERQWKLKRDVANLYREALFSAGVRTDLSKTNNIQRLLDAAGRMRTVGASGKEGGAGWKHVVDLLERALVLARESTLQSQRSEVLRRLIEAHRALRNESAILSVLSEYARAVPTDHEPWSWIGDLLLDIGLPEAAATYQRSALGLDSGFADGQVGLGEALTDAGRLDEALVHFGKSGRRGRRAAALLRLGRLDDARREAESAMAADGDDAHAVLVHGAALYAKGELDGARDAFVRAATMESGAAERAKATYNLGLTCLRLGQHDAAIQAFEACREALESGASPGAHAREAVSPSLGIALAAMARGALEEVGEPLSRASHEAPRNPYIRYLAGAFASSRDNVAGAVRALEEAKSLDTGYGEMDGWLAHAYLLLAEQQLGSGADDDTASDSFRRALAYATRAAASEAGRDRDAFHHHLRLALVQLRSRHLPQRERLAAAGRTLDTILRRPKNASQPAALTLLGWVHYTMGGPENVDQSLRDFDRVLDDIGDDAENPWSGWGVFARSCLDAVKHWKSLEEKRIEIVEAGLTKEWTTKEGSGVKANAMEGHLQFQGEASRDGSMGEPIVHVQSSSLFTRGSFEELSLEVRIPDLVGGRPANSITFGVSIMTGKGRATRKPVGLGIFYDKGHMAIRAAGGQVKAFEDGQLHRSGEGFAARAWPKLEITQWARLRFVKVDGDKGLVRVYLHTDEMPDDQEQLIYEDRISTFKQSNGPATLWIGGWANDAQPFQDVQVRDIRIVRRKKRIR